MKNRTNIFIVIIVIALVFTGCGTGNKEFRSFINEINTYNESISVPDIDLSLYTNDLNEDEMLTWDEFSSFFTNSPKDFKSNNQYKAALKGDIELYFKALRTNYAPYNYYGGDEVFIKVKEEILEYIDSQKDIKDYEIIKLMANKLSFINDKHFHIGGKSLVHSEFMYIDNKTEYFKDDEGYYKLQEDKKCYIKAIDGNEKVEENIKYSIGDDGRLIYRAFVMRKNDVIIGNNPLSDKIKVQVSFQEADNIKEEEVAFKSIGTKEYKSTPVFEYEEKDNISIVTMRAMTINGEEEARNFVQSAIDSKKSKVTILDLRDNAGGDAVLPGLWLKSRVNKLIKSNSKGVFIERFAAQPEDVGDIYNPFIYEYCSLEPINDDYYSMGDKGNQGLVRNNKYIFVLVDKFAGSAGEYFIDLLRRVENVIIVGSNTNGILESSLYGTGNLYLPNTGITFGYGNWLRVYDEDVFKEGRGFMPDIIVDDDEALDKVMQLIQYYGLN